ncbi:MAG: redoxin domain-containing protein [Chitinophagaceae bacterium]|jgi:peroxiredoxin
MKILQKIRLFFLFAIGMVVLNISAFAQDEEDKKLYEGQFAPSFSVKDLEGKFHSIDQYKGQKILLTFYRNAGDPVSYFRFNELEEQKDYFFKKGIVLLSFFESSPENVLTFKDTHQFYQVVIADPKGILYNLYGVEENRAKMARGTVHAAAAKAKKGKKLYPNKIVQDGKPNRISAEILIDENGNIATAYYGQYLGDNMPIEALKAAIEKP